MWVGVRKQNQTQKQKQEHNQHPVWFRPGPSTFLLYPLGPIALRASSLALDWVKLRYAATPAGSYCPVCSCSRPPKGSDSAEICHGKLLAVRAVHGYSH
ncbi:hypothetical protein N9L68_09150 [bacterium]|nr:hypothetical protein [bacterium]